MEVLLKRLLDISGVSGYEKEVASLLEEEFKKRGMQVFYDHLGNLFAKKGKAKKKIMLCAHMDEVGLAVKHISPKGYLYFTKVGGIDERILLGQRVRIKTKEGKEILGVIGAKPPHLQKEEEKKQSPKLEELFIDAGFKDREDAEKAIEIGAPIVFASESGLLKEELCFGKAVDDRVGCYALIKIMEGLRKIKAQIYAVATTQEEVGLKGARTAAFKINPDLAIVLDTTTSQDTPQYKEGESPNWRLGQGVAINLMEAGGRGMIMAENLKEMVIDIAKSKGIKYQIGITEGGLTDAAIIQLMREGIPTIVLSVPTRYVHSANCLFDLRDLSATIELAKRIIERQ